MNYPVGRRASSPVVSAGHSSSDPRYHVPMPEVDWVRKLCLSFPDVTEDMPWEDNLCFKVRGKIFTGVVLSDGRFPRITLKCAPEAFHELLEIEGISPAPYVGRYKWVMLANSRVLPAAELEAVIRQSYELVAANAPKKKAGREKAERKKDPRKRRAV
ncbi:MAG: MmcQ/YjbR family DNA-binding protein [Terriglobales bacterium]|jgi:predicted DNA-binding protein (MmcQ/YjbR family)